MMKQHENRKDKIVRAALGWLKRSGIKGTHMDTLARETGISKKTIYQLFGKKEKLLKEAVDTEFQYILRDLKIIAGIRRIPKEDKLVGSLLVIARRAFEGCHEVHQELPIHPTLGHQFKARVNEIIGYLNETYFSDDKDNSYTILKSLFNFLTSCAANHVKGISEIQFREQVIPFYLAGWRHQWNPEKAFMRPINIDPVIP